MLFPESKVVGKGFSSSSTIFSGDRVKANVHGALTWGKNKGPKRVSWNATDVVLIGESQFGQDSEMEEEVSLPPQSKIAPTALADFLYIGNQVDASNLELLKSLHISHIVKISRFTKEYPSEIKVLNLCIYDSPNEDIRIFFEEVIKFIDDARENNGNVLVCCPLGLSGSATICIAYLMKFHNWNLREAYDFVYKRRGLILPNMGFYNQLISFEKDIYGKTTLEPKIMHQNEPKRNVKLKPILKKPKGDSVAKVDLQTNCCIM